MGQVGVTPIPPCLQDGSCIEVGFQPPIWRHSLPACRDSPPPGMAGSFTSPTVQSHCVGGTSGCRPWDSLSWNAPGYLLCRLTPSNPGSAVAPGSTANLAGCCTRPFKPGHLPPPHVFLFPSLLVR